MNHEWEEVVQDEVDWCRNCGALRMQSAFRSRDCPDIIQLPKAVEKDYAYPCLKVKATSLFKR